MDGNVLVTQSPVALQYWNMLKNLSDNVKMELAAMLTTSLAYREELAEPELTKEEKDREFWSLCGSRNSSYD